MKILALINHKGGVAKTTSVQNITAGLALKGYKVLAIDLDAQRNLTESFGQFDVTTSIYDSFRDGKPLPIIPIKKNISLVPSSLDLASIEIEISSRMAREKILFELLKPLHKNYDYCVLDCPPSLGLITVNALVACNDVYIPMVAEFLAYRGIDTIVDVIKKVRVHYNELLSIKGVFFTKFDSKKVLTKGIKDQVEQYFGKTLLSTVIRNNIALAECQSDGKDIFEYDKYSNGASDYEKLVKEIIKLSK